MKALALGGGNMYVKEEKPVNKIVEILRKTSSHLFKFHGEVAMHLFLNDDFILPSKVDICVERKKLLEIIRVIPEEFTIHYYDEQLNERWLFRLDHHIRLPKNNIYFHSLSWNVDYIKPEIVLMYDLMSEQKYHQFSNYKAVIDSLSYYQFYILKLVVGEQRIKKAIVNSSAKKIS